MYPDIYLTPNPHLIEEWNLDQEHFCNLRYGFEFYEGWKDLVDQFSQTTTQLVQQLRESGLQTDAYVRSCIFKEKFAQLTWQGTDNLLEPFRTIYHGYVDQIERRSTNICEVTGKPGQIRSINHYFWCLSDEEYRKKLGPGIIPNDDGAPGEHHRP